MMKIKVIIRDNITMPDRIPTDADLKTLDCYYESFIFEIESHMKLDERFEYAMNVVKPYVKHMHCDTVELVAV